MDTPDKIYIADHNANVQTGYFSRSNDDVFTQEYIRKDALIELIKEESKFWDDGEMIFRGLIDKLNSM